MKARSLISTAVALLLAAGSVSALAAGQTGKSGDQARKETCFRAHGGHMGKPALADIENCWRVHGYKMQK
jgi:argininosuccinate synthase